MKLIELYCGPFFDAQMIKNLLENAGIESVLNDEIIGATPVWSSGKGVRIMVSDVDYQAARTVVEEYETTNSGSAGPSESD